MAPREDRTKRRTKYRVCVTVGVALTTIAVCAGAYYAHWVVARHRLTVIADGVVYQSAQMPPEALLEVVEDHGIRTVIDLRKDGPLVAAEGGALAWAGVEHVHLPMSQVPAPETVGAFLQVMDDPANRPVLIHCEHGEGRSVILSALYRIEYEGWTPDEARRAARLFSFRGSFAPGRKKGKYLLSYAARRSRGESPLQAHAGSTAGRRETGT